ncbi:hypothetical protein NUSPORA_02794 [Nucleospora cyclopteri]
MKYSTFGALEHVRELNSWFLLINSNVAAEKQLPNQCAVQPVFREEMLENFATIRIMWKRVEETGKSKNVPVFYAMKKLCLAVQEEIVKGRKEDEEAEKEEEPSQNKDRNEQDEKKPAA